MSETAFSDVTKSELCEPSAPELGTRGTYVKWMLDDVSGQDIFCKTKTKQTKP